MRDVFEPRNELVRCLQAAMQEAISRDGLLNIFVSSQVFMLVPDEKPSLLNIQRSARAQLLVLSAPEIVSKLVDSLGQKACHGSRLFS